MDMSTRKAEFDKAFSEFLARHERISEDEIESYPDRYGSIYCDDGYLLIVSDSDWLDFLDRIDKVFDSKIKERTVWPIVSTSIFDSVGTGSMLPIVGHSYTTCRDSVFDHFQRHFETEVDVIVPLYNFNYLPFMGEIQLANASLYPSGPDSLVAQTINQQADKSAFNELIDCCCLKIRATGDRPSQLVEAITQSENALRVLRFVSGWLPDTSDTRIERNRIGRHATWHKVTEPWLFFQNRSNPSRNAGFERLPNRNLQPTGNFLNNARGMYGLDDINYHFAHEGHPMSDRVLKAFSLYDTATGAATNWEAIYHYAVCVNVALPTGRSDGKSLVDDLNTLISHCGYIGNQLKRDESLSNPSVTKWVMKVQLTTQPYSDFYTIRNNVTHGFERVLDNVSDDSVEEARELARNAIQSIAKLSRELKWRTYKDGKKWFKAPKSPPSLRLLKVVKKLEKELSGVQESYPDECQSVKRCLHEAVNSIAGEPPNSVAVRSSLKNLYHACSDPPELLRARKLTTDFISIIDEIETIHGELIALPILQSN